MDFKKKMAEQIKKESEKKLKDHPEVRRKIELVENLKAGGQIVEVPVKDILDDKTFQIRSESISKEDFDNLKSSIKKHGIKIPVFVRKSPAEKGKYQMLAGFNRFLVAKELGLKTIKAIYNDVNDEDAYTVAEIENLVRTQLSFYDMLCYIKKLEERGLSVNNIAERLDKSKRTIFSHKQIGANDKLTDLVKNEKITYFDATKLIRLPEDQLSKAIAKLESHGTKEDAKKSVSKSTTKPACVINEEKGTIMISIKGTIRGKESVIKELKKAIDDIESIKK
jgi:ParB family transcriptional regulator, chromosome partitioning protein